MQAAVRPWMTTGIAIVGASVIAVAPIVAVPAPPDAPVAVTKVPTPTLPDVQLTASIADILQFPAFRQFVVNTVGDFLIRVGGLVEAGTNLAEVLGAVPETLRLLTQQLLSLDLLGALNTIETALVGGLAAVFLPIIESRILINERNLAIQLALASAVPEALIGAGLAIVGAVDAVLQASITGGQEVVDAILTFDLGNIVNALVSATTGFVGSFAVGGQILVDGIVFVQQTIAEALAAQPPAAPAATDAELSGPSSVPNLDDSEDALMVATSSEMDQAGRTGFEPLGADEEDFEEDDAKTLETEEDSESTDELDDDKAVADAGETDPTDTTGSPQPDEKDQTSVESQAADEEDADKPADKPAADTN